jgi:lipid II:glycine glycyltransferase (peptidoglycan interpeptide bridge formation enzyme)
MTVTVRRWEDPATWNSFVSALPDAHFQQSWEWGELAPDLGGRAVRLAALRADRVVGAAQVFVNPVGSLNRTYLYIPRGPALCGCSIETLGPILDHARMIGEECGALGIRVEPNVAESDHGLSDVLSALGLAPAFPPSQPRSSWLLNIDSDEDVLLAEMRQKTRYNIRLAARKGVTVREGGEKDLDVFLRLYRETAERDDFFIHSRALYARMFSLFRQAGNFCLLLAYAAEEPIAAVTLVRFGRTCWYVHGASSNRQRNLMAPHLLQWEAILRAKQWGCTLYDFRAVPDILREDQDMYGVYRFKEGFGGYRLTTQHTWSQPYDPLLFGLWQVYFRARFDFDAWRRRRRGLPARQFA